MTRRKADKQIAGGLGIVEETIKVHRAHFMDEMGARSLAELARMAGRLGIQASPNGCTEPKEMSMKTRQAFQSLFVLAAAVAFATMPMLANTQGRGALDANAKRALNKPVGYYNTAGDPTDCRRVRSSSVMRCSS